MHSPPPPELMTLILFSDPLLLPPTLRQRLLRTTCHLPCLLTTRLECKTTVLRRQARLELLNRSLEPLRVNLVRLHYPPHPLKTRVSFRPEGQASHNQTSSRTAVLQMPSPRRRCHRVNHSNLNSHSFRQRYSKLRMHRNNPRVRPLLLNNIGLRRLRRLVVP